MAVRALMLPGVERDDDPGFWIPFVQRVAQKVEQEVLPIPHGP